LPKLVRFVTAPSNKMTIVIPLSGVLFGASLPGLLGVELV
jgi:hypothetical protein